MDVIAFVRALLSVARIQCRRCGEVIVAGDRFGASEGVCPACRGAR
jgi:hypothetical protein